MPQQFVTEQLRQKWAPVIEHADLPTISDDYRKNVTAILLENQEQYLRETTNSSGAGGLAGLGSDTSGDFNKVAGFDPVLISLVRRAMPNLIAYDICGVQPMNAPTGLIFAMKSKYVDRNGAEALFNEARTLHSATASGTSTGGNPGAATAGVADPLGVTDNAAEGTDLEYNAYGGMSTTRGESLGDGTSGNHFNEMAFVIDRQSVVAKTRALKAEYTTELAQDLKAVHGLDAETELANILSTEILTEINREVVRTIYRNAKLGAQQIDLFHKGNTATVSALGATALGGIYDLERDSDGRWSAERFRGLIYQIEREANVIAKETRRGKGNIVLCTSDVASALAMSGFLNLTPTPNVPGYADDTANTYIGTLNGSIKVYIDPYSVSGSDYCVVGYRGSSPYDAGMFYCPYVPLQMVRAVGENSFQPKIGFKTRYGLVNNPFVSGNGVGSAADKSDPHSNNAIRCNQYYRIFRVDSIHGAV